MAFRDWPIRRKLSALLFLTSGVVLLLTVSTFLTFEVVTLRSATRKDLSTLGRIIAANSTASLAFSNQADAREILAALRANPHVVAAGLYDARRQLFARYPADLPIERLPAEPGADGYRFGVERLVGFEPVAEPGAKRLGTLYLESDIQAIYDALRLSGIIGTLVVAVALLAAYLVGKVLQQRISGPILALVEAATAVSERQDYSVRAPGQGADELGKLTTAFNQMLGQIEEQNQVLEQRVAARTADLLAANTELDAFAYSVSHDLRAPLRSIDGFSQILLEDYGTQLDAAGQDSLKRVRAASQRMGMLIDDLLKLARVSRTDIQREAVDLSAMARDIVSDLERASPRPEIEVVIAPDLEVRGDSTLLRAALENLLGNSWKYTTKQPKARIEFSAAQQDGERVFMVRDNGAGFDMKYMDKLFGVFQRLHSEAEFQGTGVGLATVRRILTRHGGRIWAEAELGRGATFYFTL